MTTRTASCACGALELRCKGDPSKVSMCHCVDCQRRTGSLFSIAAFFRREAVATVKGRPSQFTRGSASGYPVTFHFCPACGANVFWEPARMPHLIAVGVGAFGDPDFPMPAQAVWTADRHKWLTLPDGLPTFDNNPPPRPPAA